MATTRQLTALFQALSRGDLESATRTALIIAEDAERRGHRRAAQALRGSLKPNERASKSEPRMDESPATALGLLIAEHPDVGLGEVRLRRDARAQLDDLILEYKYLPEFQERDIDRRRTLLFTGPPGCGKSMTARALGRELEIPVYTVRLSAVVGAYLGQTGANLHQLFRLAENQTCVLLLDEIDSLAQSRGRAEDVGELDRVVISLLQELDHSCPAGITIAATNRPESLDEALLRRFDCHIEFPSPNKKELASFARGRSKEYGLRLSKADQQSLSGASTYADIDKGLESIRRRRVLDELRDGD